MIALRSDKILETSERRGEVSKIAAGRTEPEKALPRPDPEVPAKATRRRFSARYKLRINTASPEVGGEGEVPRIMETGNGNAGSPKKVSQLLGISLASSEENGDES